MRNRMAVLVLSVLILALAAVPALADSPTVQIVFDTGIQSTVTIGRTPKLLISITNPGPNPIRSTSFFCRLQESKTGPTPLTASSISQLPGTIAPNTTFHTEQVYRAVAGGSTVVDCVLNAVDTVTGVAVTIDSNQAQLMVLSETRLEFNSSSATRYATVGQSVFVMSTYTNHGSTTFTNVQVNCTEIGRSMDFISTRQNMPTIAPGQSGFVEDQWRAFRTGNADVVCSVSAIDSGNGQTVTIPAPTVHIDVR